MKKLLIVIPILLVVILLLIPKNKQSSMIVSLSDYDFKSGATFKGTAIYNDGTIYTWYYSSSKSEYNKDIGKYSIKTKEGLTSYFTEKGSKKDYKVTSHDLSQIKKYITELSKEDNTCITDSKVYTELTIYQNDQTKTIPVTTNCNINPHIQDISNLINKYNNIKTKKTK